MNDSVTGRALGQDTYDAQLAAGAAFLASLGGTLPNAEQAAAVAVIMAKIAGNATITHCPGWDQISFDPSTGEHADPALPATTPSTIFNRPMPAVAQQVDGAGHTVALWWKTGAGVNDWKKDVAGTTDDHLVIAVSGDNPDVLYQKVQVTYPLTETVGGTAPNQHVLIGYAPDPVDPAVVESTLYMAKVGDPLDCGSVYCTFLGPHSTGGNTPMFEGNWEEVLPGVMQRTTVGLLGSTWFDGVDFDPAHFGGVSPIVGKRVIAYYQGDTSATGYEEPRQEVFIVDDVGMVFTDYGLPTQTVTSTYARMHRDPDFSYSAAWTQYMKFAVDNGTLYGGGYLEFLNSGAFVLGTTFVNWSWTSGAMPTTEKEEALTGPQLTSEKASQETLEFSTTTASSGGYVEAPMPNGFVTLAGTPDVTSIDVGVFRFDVEQVRVSGSGSPGSTTAMRVYIQDPDNGMAEILSADSPPISSTTNVPLSFTAVLSIPYTFAPDRRLLVQYFIRTNSTTPVTLTMRYNSAVRGTKVTIPFAMPVTGSADGDHQHLTRRDQDVASSDSTKADPCHPWNALGPTGRQHVTYGTATFSAPVATMPANSSKARLALNDDVGGVTYTGFLDGDDIDLRIAADSSARNVFNDVINHTTHPDAASIKLHGSTAGARALTIPANGRVFLRLRLNMTDFAYPTWEQVIMEIS